MSRSDWEAIYREAWSLLHFRPYEDSAATGWRDRRADGSLVKLLLTFATTVRLENVHPLRAAFSG
jgi:hypothetical protein